MVDKLYRISGWMLSALLFGISAIAAVLGGWHYFVLYAAAAIVICPRISVPLWTKLAAVGIALFLL